MEKSLVETIRSRWEQDGLGGRRIQRTGEQGPSQSHPTAHGPPLNQDGKASGRVDGSLNWDSRGPVTRPAYGDDTGGDWRPGWKAPETARTGTRAPRGEVLPSRPGTSRVEAVGGVAHQTAGTAQIHPLNATAQGTDTRGPWSQRQNWAPEPVRDSGRKPT